MVIEPLQSPLEEVWKEPDPALIESYEPHEALRHKHGQTLNPTPYNPKP